MTRRDPEKMLRAFLKLGADRTLIALADKTGVPLSTLKRYSAQFKWVERAAVHDQNPHRRAGRLVVPVAAPSPASSAASYAAARAACDAVRQRVRDRDAAIAAEEAQRAQEAEAARRAAAPVPVPDDAAVSLAPMPRALTLRDFEAEAARRRMPVRELYIGHFHEIGRATGKHFETVRQEYLAAMKR